MRHFTPSIILLLCSLCMVSRAETIDTTLSQSIEKLTKINVVSTVDHIIKGHKLSSSNKTSFEIIRQNIHDNEIAIEIFTSQNANGQTEYFAYNVRKEYDKPHVLKLFDEDEFDRELEKGDKLFIDTTVATLLLNPLREELLGVKKIFFTPAGKLHLFAIEYCNAGGGQMIAEKYEFFRLTSSAVLSHRKDQCLPYKSYVIYGGIDYELAPDYEESYDGYPAKCQLGYLQDSYLAAKEIHSFLDSKGASSMLLANEFATESSFKALPWQNIQVFFIETHGVSYPKQTEKLFPNALMLAGSSYIMIGGIVPKDKEDGLLTTEEISMLDLSSIDLAVISACKSALGEIDDQGVDGLMRAFKTAGVNSLVMTTDDVVDYVSGEVWKVFFKNIANGMSKRESLLDAVKHVRIIHDGFFGTPKYWTPFILIDGIN